MNKKMKTVIAFGVGFFVGTYAMAVAQVWLCERGETYIYFKESGHEYGNRKIIPPSSWRCHWNSDSKKEEEVPE